MTPTLQNFTHALLTPDLSLLTLAGVSVKCSSDGLPVLVRTTRFAEVEITYQGAQWLLALPLNPAVLLRIGRIASALGRLRSDSLTEYQILPREMLWVNFAGEALRCDLVIQRLPEGVGFDDALRSTPRERLLDALESLRQELRELHVMHNNLKAANLRWTGARFVPVRYHDASIGGSFDLDDAAFEALRQRIDSMAEPLCVGDVVAPYEVSNRLTGHLWSSHLFEGLVCVEDTAGYGFVDADNRVVIESQFLWADDFHEGRAEVETPKGMGLIDRRGNYVIAPEYEIVDYDYNQSVVHVRRRGRWELFDYQGQRLSDLREHPQA